MHRYISNTDAQKKEMLESIGANSIDDLFVDIPEELRFNGELNIGDPMSEIEILKHMNELQNKNLSTNDLTCFLGAGSYDHYIPTIINHIALRQEFFTAYTPYQPEVSQGTLQAIFEYQTMITRLTGMEVTNASMYDGPTATAESLVLACDNARKEKVIISGACHPDILAVCKTALETRGIEIIEAPIKDGVTDLDGLQELMSDDIAGVVIQNPNFFGIIEDVCAAEKIVHSGKKTSYIVYADPVSLGILKTPGECGADMVVGDAQGIGSPMAFGGPTLGFLTATKKLVRKLPGRIVGQSEDAEGKRAFVLTLQAREQHIRRFKATSNICSNQGLVMLMTTIHLATLGKKGLREVAIQTTQKAHYAFDKLMATGKFKELFPGKPFFKEFALASDINVKELNKKLLENKILGGYELGRDFKEYENGILFCVTEKRTKEEIDELARIMEVI